MTNKVDIMDVVAVIIEQRNSALNALAETSATVVSLRRQIKGANQNETDTEDTTT